MGDPVMEVFVRYARLQETIALVSALRPCVALEVVQGEVREPFLFERNVFRGPEATLARLRALLAQRVPMDVYMRTHDTLAGLYGAPEVSVVALVLDPEGTLGC